ncbi:MAG: hypothetical protein ABIP63_01985 [Thermoanaerobaculia bacterium]
MPTLMQKIRLIWRGWNRRRKEDAAGREQEFLARSSGWGKPVVVTPVEKPVPLRSSAGIDVDIEGLTVAFLDDSGQIAHYLDTESGEVVDVRGGAALALPRFRRVPARTPVSDEADRRAFTVALEPPQRQRLETAVQSPEEFRQALSLDRALERGWYNFKNDRAIEAIERWLRESG